MGLLLAFVVSEPLIAHVCPKHLQARTQGAADELGAMVEHAHGLASPAPLHAGAHAEHGAASQAPIDAAVPNPASAPLPHGCDCVGQCEAGNVVAGPRSAAIAFAAVVEPAPTFPILEETAAAPRAERLLPPANGPPRTTRV